MLTDSGDPATPPAKKEKLTALDKLLGSEQLSQDSITLENELENIWLRHPFLEKKTLLHGGKLMLLDLKLSHQLKDSCCVCLLLQHQQKGFSTLQD